MMSDKVKRYKDHRAVKFIMSSPDPRPHRRVGRGVRNFPSTVCDSEKQCTLSLGIYAKLRRIQP